MKTNAKPNHHTKVNNHVLFARRFFGSLTIVLGWVMVSTLTVVEANASLHPAVSSIDQLIQAMEEENEPLFRALIRKGVDVDAVGSEGWNPLCFAAACGQLHFAKLLLEAGANVNYLLVHDGTPLILATRRGDVPMVELLLEHGAKVNQSLAGDGNPLIVASAQGHTSVATLLVTRGADVNAVVEGDETPLISAARNGRLNIVKYLIAQGTDVNLSMMANTATQPERRSPLNQALQYGHTAVADYLRKQGAKQ